MTKASLKLNKFTLIIINTQFVRIESRWRDIEADEKIMARIINQGCSEDFSKIAKNYWIFESTKN